MNTTMYTSSVLVASFCLSALSAAAAEDKQSANEGMTVNIVCTCQISGQRPLNADVARWDSWVRSGVHMANKERLSDTRFLAELCYKDRASRNTCEEEKDFASSAKFYKGEVQKP
jgi:hypothetical protein